MRLFCRVTPHTVYITPYTSHFIHYILHPTPQHITGHIVHHIITPHNSPVTRHISNLTQPSHLALHSSFPTPHITTQSTLPTPHSDTCAVSKKSDACSVKCLTRGKHQIFPTVILFLSHPDSGVVDCTSCHVCYSLSCYHNFPCLCLLCPLFSVIVL